MMGILGFVIGFALALLAGLFLQRHFRKIEEDSQEGFFLAGLNVGVMNHANWIRKTRHLEVQGFAISCEKCDHIFCSIQSVRNEYSDCPECGFHCPAPLAPERKKHDAR